MSAAHTNEPSSSSGDPIRGLAIGDLLAIGSQLRADITPEGLLREVAETIQRISESRYVYVRLRDTETDELRAVAFAGVEPAVSAQFQAVAIDLNDAQRSFQPAFRVSESYLLPAAALARFAPGSGVPGEQAPTLLILFRGRSERLICLIYATLSHPQARIAPAHIQVVEAVVRQAALALENVRLAERSARLLAKEQLLAQLGRDVSETLDRATILSRTMARLEAAFGGGAFALLNDAGELEVVAAAARDSQLQGLSCPLGAGVLSWVIEHGQSYFASEAEADGRFSNLSGAADDSMICRSAIAVALRSGGHVIGALGVSSPLAHAFSFDDLDFIEAIAAQVSGPITSARLYDEAQRLAVQVQRRADQLAVLNSIAGTATQSLAQEHLIERALPAVSAQISNGFGYEYVDIFLVDEESDDLVLVAVSGHSSLVHVDDRQLVHIGLPGKAVRTMQTIVVADVRALSTYLALAERTTTRAALCVPIVASGRALGVINLESPIVAAFGDEDVKLIETVADVLAGPLENVRLFRRAQTAAVLEERNRLARDLHDSVSQQLFSMVLTAQAARAQLERNPQRVAAQLERLQETAQAALAEMRALIFQLRPPALRDQGLVAALQQHAQLLSRREGLHIELAVTGDERLARGIEQPLYRIVQEALNNVVKHAAARKVAVQLDFNAEHIVVRVHDDGKGFDLNSAPSLGSPHLGVISMRERAAELGGTMELRTSPGSGTEVTVCIPRA